MTTVTQHNPNTPVWFDVMTTNTDAARAFYHALFGWTYEIGGADTGFYTMCKLGSEVAAGLGAVHPGQNMPTAWTVYFGVADADATVEKVKAAGGQVMVPVMDVLDQGRMAVCVDPTGASFGLWQPMAHIGTTVTDQHGAMAWCEVNTRNGAAAAEFYRNVFDLEPQKLDDASITYYLLNQNGVTVAGVLQMGPDFANASPQWMPYFRVDNLDESSLVVTANGGKVTHGPFDSPHGRLAVIMDPQGGTLSIIAPPEAPADLQEGPPVS